MEILVAEDDAGIALMYKAILIERRGHHVTVTSSGENCLKIYHERLQNV